MKNKYLSSFLKHLESNLENRKMREYNRKIASWVRKRKSFNILPHPTTIISFSLHTKNRRITAVSAASMIRINQNQKKNRGNKSSAADRNEMKCIRILSYFNLQYRKYIYFKMKFPPWYIDSLLITT